MDNSSTWNPSTDAYLAWDNAAGDRPVAGDWNADGRTETGVYRPGVGFYLKMDNGSTWNPSTDVNPAYTFRGEAGWTPIVGDWNGNGNTKIGIYKFGSWYLDSNGNRVWDSGDKELLYSTQLYTTPVVGDWNGDGNTTVGYRLYELWHLDYSGEGTYSTYSFIGPDPYQSYIPVVGDWNGDRKTELGLYNILNGAWYLDYDGNGDWNSGSDRSYNFGVGVWTPVVGDWNGNGTSKIGVYKNGVWRLDYYGNGSLINVYSFGASGSTPIIGDWNGNGKSKIGIYNSLNGDWNLDYDGNGVWDATADKAYNMGVGTPVVGKWS